jgi:hypothetical protein
MRCPLITGSAHTRNRRPSSADAPSVSRRPGLPASTRAVAALAAVALSVSDVSDRDCRSLLRHSLPHSRPGGGAVTRPSRAVRRKPGISESGAGGALGPQALQRGVQTADCARIEILGPCGGHAFEPEGSADCLAATSRPVWMNASMAGLTLPRRQARDTTAGSASLTGT